MVRYNATSQASYIRWLGSRLQPQGTCLVNAREVDPITLRVTPFTEENPSTSTEYGTPTVSVHRGYNVDGGSPGSHHTVMEA
eukprot:5461903-Amphidinium_carterae.2